MEMLSATLIFLTSLPVKSYLNIIGQPEMVDGLDDAINRGLTVRELSLDIRKALFRRRVFSRRLFDLVEILQDLKLIARHVSIIYFTSSNLTANRTSSQWKC